MVTLYEELKLRLGDKGYVDIDVADNTYDLAWAWGLNEIPQDTQDLVDDWMARNINVVKTGRDVIIADIEGFCRANWSIFRKLFSSEAGIWMTRLDSNPDKPAYDVDDDGNIIRKRYESIYHAVYAVMDIVEGNIADVDYETIARIAHIRPYPKQTSRNTKSRSGGSQKPTAAPAKGTGHKTTWADVKKELTKKRDLPSRSDRTAKIEWTKPRRTNRA